MFAVVLNEKYSHTLSLFLMFWLFPGFRGSVDANGFPVGQYPEIRGTGYVESNDPVQVGGGAPQQRVFRNSQPATPAPSYGVSPSYQARQYEEQLYNFQNFNGQGQAQYYGANGKKWRWTPLCSFILTRQWSFKRHLLSSLSSHHFPLHPKFDWKPVFCVGRLLWYKTHGGDHHHFIVIWEWNVMSDCAVCVMLLLLLLFTV